MNAYQVDLERLKTTDECDLQVLKEIRSTRPAREEVREASVHDWLSHLPYSSKPKFLGEPWKV